MSAVTALAAPDQPSWLHAHEADYAAYLRSYLDNEDAIGSLLRRRRRFVRHYPDLRAWFAAPLGERVGWLYTPAGGGIEHPVSYAARNYLVYLALHGHVRFDWEWLVGTRCLRIWGWLSPIGVEDGLARLRDEAVGLGYAPAAATPALQWTLSRLFLHTGGTDIDRIEEAHVAELGDEVRRFGGRPDVDAFFGSTNRYRRDAANHSGYLHLLQAVLYHRGQARTEPRRRVPPRAVLPPVRPGMEAIVARYLERRRLTDRPSTLQKFGLGLRRFVAWLAMEQPGIETFAGVTREHALDYAAAVDGYVSPRTGQPLTVWSRRNYLSALVVFFQDVAAWGWEGVPVGPLLLAADLPKPPLRVPRYIPQDELARLMAAVCDLRCPYQRTALLIARWSGARRGEIRRLPLDCLDAYADGTPRLHVPLGKTHQERLVPVHTEAAEAIRGLRALGGVGRGLLDERSGELTRYLFVRHGKLLSVDYLFEEPLARACAAAGLVDPDGHPLVTAHRFRHTVGMQLAEHGAKLQTVMSVLGHTTPAMAMVYAQVSDAAVLGDYRKVLGPGATVAGPLAETLRKGELPASAIDWLKTNFFKTELELGHCLRLPQEGPCECDLYLSCAKFV
ncbi:MAG: site-specific integrase, partial [Chloroflexota bacterium]|nr:site-specific integrase [Chloroflexota bacterium]